jgi:predicted metal-binding membrane protein
VDADAWTDLPGAGASFLGMWVVMMMAMMLLPSLVPMLLHYRQAVPRQARRTSVR